MRLALLSLLLLSACNSGPPINTPAVLVKKDPLHEGKTLPLTVADIKSNPQRDVLSFGVAECEDQVAVREAGAALSSEDGAPVIGFCSKACTPGVTDCRSGDVGLDNHPETVMSCRALLIDQQMIDTLCNDDPPKLNLCNTTPYYCARSPK